MAMEKKGEVKDLCECATEYSLPAQKLFSFSLLLLYIQVACRADS